MTAAQTTVKQVEQLGQQTNGSLAALEARMAALEAKLQRARQLVNRLEQPVSYSKDTYTAVANPKAGMSDLLHNHISLDFQYTKAASGVILFTENKQGLEFMAIQMVGQHLVYRFDNGNKVVEVYSAIDLCVGCWFRVVATR